ncbi:MAG: hypothetical protein ACLUFV_10940 [Acutalibacteraceae bacterium]|jgi:hypothetical protein
MLWLPLKRHLQRAEAAQKSFFGFFALLFTGRRWGGRGRCRYNMEAAPKL